MHATDEVQVSFDHQQVKREMFRLAMEKADAELVLTGRDGQSGQGTRRRGTSPMTFKTRFGTVEVQRQRVEDKATGKVTTPAARAWNTPQQVTITRGLRQQVCQTVRNQSMQASLEQADEPGLLGKTTVEEIVHAEGKALEEALRQRAQAVMDAHPQAALFVPAAERAGQGMDDEESLFEDFAEPEPLTRFGEMDEAEEFERLEGPRAVDQLALAASGSVADDPGCARGQVTAVGVGRRGQVDPRLVRVAGLAGGGDDPVLVSSEEAVWRMAEHGLSGPRASSATGAGVAGVAVGRPRGRGDRDARVASRADEGTRSAGRVDQIPVCSSAVPTQLPRASVGRVVGCQQPRGEAERLGRLAALQA
jgi:hypothetical protein